MIGLLCFVLTVLVSVFKSKSRLEAENAALRHQLIVLRRKARGRAQLTNNDRWFFVQLYRWFPSILQVLTIIRPDTLVRWHQAGFRRYWRWKSRDSGRTATNRDRAARADPADERREPALGVRREKAALSSGRKSHPATAPAGSNRSSHGGNKVAEASG